MADQPSQGPGPAGGGAAKKKRNRGKKQAQKEADPSAVEDVSQALAATSLQEPQTPIPQQIEQKKKPETQQIPTGEPQVKQVHATEPQVSEAGTTHKPEQSSKKKKGAKKKQQDVEAQKEADPSAVEDVSQALAATSLQEPQTPIPQQIEQKKKPETQQIPAGEPQVKQVHATEPQVSEAGTTHKPEQSSKKKKGAKKKQQDVETQEIQPSSSVSVVSSRESSVSRDLPELQQQAGAPHQRKQPWQQQRGPQEQQREYPQQQRGPPQQQPGPQQQQRGPWQQQGGPQQQQRGPPEKQRGPPHQQQGPQQQQRGPPPQQQIGSQPQQRGPWQQQGGPQQQQRGPPHQQQGPQQQQRGPPPQQQIGSQPQQRGPWQQQGGHQQQRGPPEIQRGPPHQQQGPQQQQRGPPPQQQIGSQPQQRGPWQQQGVPQQQQRGPWQQQGGPQQQRGPPQQQTGPPQQQTGPPQQQTGPPQQQRGPPQHQREPQVQQRGPSQEKGTEAEAALVPGAPDLSTRMPVRREKSGTLGRKIIVETNHLALKMSKKLDKVIHYDVSITPDKPKKLFSRIWREFHTKYLRNSPIAFDGVKNAYSPQMLPCGESQDGEVEVSESDFDRPRIYKVEMKYASRVNLNSVQEYLFNEGRTQIPQDALQVIDVVLRNAPSAKYVRVGRSYFREPSERIYLSDGLELWYGFYQSVILGWKPFLNIDVAHKGFPTEQRVLDLIAEFHRCRPEELGRFDDRLKSDIEKTIKGLKILYEIPGQPASRRTYRVAGLEKPATRAEFLEQTQKVPKKTTVQLYYQESKKYTLKYPFLPCLHVGPKTSHIMLPAELCVIMKGQVVNKKLNERQVSTMIRYANTDTRARKQKLMNVLREVNYNVNPYVQAFGFSVNDQFERVEARVLDPPTLKYNDRRQVTPSRGVWRAQIFYDPAKLVNWTVLNLCKYVREQTIENFVRSVERQAAEVGMQINRGTRPFESIPPTNAAITSYFTRNKNMNLVFVVVPEMKFVYAQVKQIAELQVGCLTQCLKQKTIERMNQSTLGNILLKVNAKLDGKNHVLMEISRPPCLQRPCMLMGADVTHPSPDQMAIPSVAAVCASYDALGFHYNFRWRLQPARQEIIDDLEDIVKDQLKFFYIRTRYKPERIIFFRDGVSEGQFEQVLNAEVYAIRKACRQLQSDYEPKVTFLVVQKRHHTRFFPTNPEESEDRNMNVRAGTLVDTSIVHRSYMEYYLVSHASIQGVARPTKYRVLWDDADMSQDEIQQLTYFLCHMFARCTRSVSYPAPTYYAHLAAFRARVYLEGADIDMNKLDREQTERKIKEALSGNFPMYFV